MGRADALCRTAETFKDGWVSTGDEVYFNERKEIFVVDRIKVRLFSAALTCLTPR